MSIATYFVFSYIQNKGNFFPQKLFAGRRKALRGPHAARGPHFGHPWSKEILDFMMVLDELSVIF